MEKDQEREAQKEVALARQKELELQLEIEKARKEAKDSQGDIGRAATSTTIGDESIKGPKVPKFNEKNDIDVYLRSFERLATIHQWNRSTWATRLAANLSGKALEAFSRMAAEDSADYDKVRDAILKRYELTGEAYRKKFRYSRREGDETFAEWSIRLRGFLDRWWEVEKVTGPEPVKNLLVRKQLLSTSFQGFGSLRGIQRRLRKWSS